MKKRTVFFLAAAAVLGGSSVPVVRAKTLSAEDILFMEIPMTVTASRQPSKANNAPATVYVLTSEDIKDSGAMSVPEVLRQVPGVDVMLTRTSDPQVSIRGMNHAMANNILVLVDGKDALMGYFDTMLWENLPITMDEIDRIEVVEGAASALYGANAVNGVINIITKTPDQLRGGIARLAGGERKTRMGSAVYGDLAGKWDYKFGAGWNSTNEFERASRLASNASKFHAHAGYQIGEASNLSVSGGLSNINSKTDVSAVAVPYVDGPSGFLRADLVSNKTRLRAHWNHSNPVLRDFALYGNPNLQNDDYNVVAEQAVSLSPSNELVVGGEYTRRAMRSKIFGSASRKQDLWAAFFEDTWLFVERWSFVASARADHHPLTGFSISPRTSVIYKPASSHSFRVSGGTSFKYPNLIENYLDLNVPSANAGGSSIPNPPYSQISVNYKGNQDLDPQRLEMVEVAHNGDFDRVRTSLAAFHYRIRDFIDATQAVPVSPAPTPPVFPLQATYFNRSNDARAVGGEFGLHLLLARGITGFANYSYQSVRFESKGRISQPKHKANGGVRFKRNGLTSSVWASWVDKTYWNANAAGGPVNIVRLDDYLLVNAYVGYALQKKLEGLEVGLSVFNLGDHKHHEILPAQGPAEPGQLGEIIRSRVAGTVSYRF